MSGYAADFASVYDALMPRDYRERADYLLRVFARHGETNPKSLLDLGCGTGSLTRLLAERGIEMTGVDASADMLSRARQNDEAGAVLWVCQPLEELDLYGTAAGAVATYDVLNHLATEDRLAAFFARLQWFLDPGGLFVFDVNTPYKHRVVLADNTFVYDTPQAYCVWQNTPLLPRGGVRISLDFFLPQPGGGYRRAHEQFCERAYTRRQLCAAASPAFRLLAVYNDKTFDPPSPTSERLVYVMQKIKKDGME